MTLTQIFLASFTSPKKLAAFRLMPIGKVIQYVFIFVTLLTIMSFVNFTIGFNQDFSGINGLLEYMDEMEWILYPFAFVIQFIMSTILIFARICIMAFAGMIILKFYRRRGDYRHVWRTTAFAYTVPTLLSILFLYMGLSDGWITLITTLSCFVYLVLSLKYYPKK
jgi:hypothetical protein